MPKWGQKMSQPAINKRIPQQGTLCGNPTEEKERKKQLDNVLNDKPPSEWALAKLLEPSVSANVKGKGVDFSKGGYEKFVHSIEGKTFFTICIKKLRGDELHGLDCVYVAPGDWERIIGKISRQYFNKKIIDTLVRECILDKINNLELLKKNEVPQLVSADHGNVHKEDSGLYAAEQIAYDASPFSNEGGVLREVYSASRNQIGAAFITTEAKEKGTEVIPIDLNKVDTEYSYVPLPHRNGFLEVRFLSEEEFVRRRDEQEMKLIEAEVQELIEGKRKPDEFYTKGSPGRQKYKPSALEFLRRVYGKYLQIGKEVLYQDQLRKIDGGLMNALEDYSSNHKVKLREIIPPKCVRNTRALKHSKTFISENKNLVSAMWRRENKSIFPEN